MSVLWGKTNINNNELLNLCDFFGKKKILKLIRVLLAVC